MLLENITKRSISCSGDQEENAPALVIWLVRTAVAVMWWHHDHIHAPIWGRGDGLNRVIKYYQGDNHPEKTLPPSNSLRGIQSVLEGVRK
jgi:hypothetical protein